MEIEMERETIAGDRTRVIKRKKNGQEVTKLE